MKKILFILGLLLIFPSIVKASSIDEQRNALIETANAYYRQGIQLQYDSYKKNLYQTPEDATTQHYNYTVCSGFTFQTYYQTLGIKIPETTEELLDYGANNKNNTNITLIYKSSKDEIYTNEFLGQNTSNATNLAKDWINFLQPGDIFVVTGHAMLIESVDRENGKVSVLESSFASGEGRYDLINHQGRFEKNGTMGKKDLVTLLNYYYKSKVDRLAIIRIINDQQTFVNAKGETIKYELTKSVESRMKYPKIDIEKTVDIESSIKDQSLFTNLNDQMTYTINITNNSSTVYENLVVTEFIDEKVTVINNGGGTQKDNSVIWTIPSINSKETYKIEFTVKVINDKNNLGKIILSTGQVDNIATSKIETLISTSINSEEEKKLIDTFNSIKDNNQVEREFINEVYKKALNIDLGITDIKNSDILKYDSSIKEGGYNTLSVKTTSIINENIKKYILQNFYGLRITEKNVPDSNQVRASLQWNIYPEYEILDRARTLNEDILNTGDIILVYNGKTSTTDTELIDKSYIYINNKLVRKVSQNEFEELSDDELNKFLLNTIGDNYVLLRPSITFERVIENNNDNGEDDQINDDKTEEDEDPEYVENPNTGKKTIYIILILSIIPILVKKYKTKFYRI